VSRGNVRHGRAIFGTDSSVEGTRAHLALAREKAAKRKALLACFLMLVYGREKLYRQ